jgi:3-oxoacyl-[acyl-carrier protein] reductase
MTGRIVLVTGGSRGIGLELVRAFARTGDRVWFNDLRDEQVQETVRRLAEEGLETVGRACDVTSFTAVGALIEEIVAAEGRLDVLVNNAGITRDALMMRMGEEQWDLVMQTNLKGCFNTIRHAVKPMMKQRDGRIINIASVVGVMGNAGQANYSAAKAGVIGLTKTMARELASRNVLVNAVAPGYIETEMTAQLPQAAKDELSRQIPLGRHGQPADVAAVVLFLASGSAAYITGQVLQVDGGMHM